MDTITTTLKRKPFADIVDGFKHVEYREIKPYWTSRLSQVRTPFCLVLRNGMIPPVPIVTVRIDEITEAKGHYELHIGRVIKVEHWDQKNKRPK